MKVVIVNYGMGNIRSIISAVKYLEISDIVVSNEKSEIEKADKLRELKKLLDEGILTQEEFESEKKKILDKANL